MTQKCVFTQKNIIVFIFFLKNGVFYVVKMRIYAKICQRRRFWVKFCELTREKLSGDFRNRKFITTKDGEAVQ